MTSSSIHSRGTSVKYTLLLTSLVFLYSFSSLAEFGVQSDPTMSSDQAIALACSVTCSKPQNNPATAIALTQPTLSAGQTVIASANDPTSAAAQATQALTQQFADTTAAQGQLQQLLATNPGLAERLFSDPQIMAMIASNPGWSRSIATGVIGSSGVMVSGSVTAGATGVSTSGSYVDMASCTRACSTQLQTAAQQQQQQPQMDPTLLMMMSGNSGN
jgi:hypothetical protein